MNDKQKITEHLVKEARKGSLSSPRSIIFYVLAFLYVLSPIDLIPDAFIGLGQADDAMVIIGAVWYIIRLLRERKKN